MTFNILAMLMTGVNISTVFNPLILFLLSLTVLLDSLSIFKRLNLFADILLKFPVTTWHPVTHLSAVNSFKYSNDCSLVS